MREIGPGVNTGAVMHLRPEGQCPAFPETILILTTCQPFTSSQSQASNNCQTV